MSLDAPRVPSLRKQIMAYLHRHAAPGSDPGDAELVVTVRRLAGRMTPQQLGECLARLKREIGGEFDVVEADEHRVVLTAQAGDPTVPGSALTGAATA